MLTLDVALMSETGGRPYNEDAAGHWRGQTQLCCVLADGAGGHGGGDVASRTAVQEFIARFAATLPVDPLAMADMVREVNAALISQRQAGSATADMHSTLVCLVIDFVEHRARWVHAGDSRMYWFRAGRLLSRTRDHSVLQSLLDAGLLSAGDSASHPNRSELSSALGVAPELLEVSSDSGEPVEPGDVFLLCSDGLWEYVDEATLEATLVAAAEPQAWLAALTQAVRAGAAHKTSHDNFSALTIWARAS
jgi:serine/threonine protein phosphatase PrpC